MSELIPIAHAAIAGERRQTVNARDLHTFLQSKTRFNDWIKKRIADYRFTEGVDFTRIELSADMIFAESGDNLDKILSAPKNVALESTGYLPNGQQGRIEYAITLDMAKELSMVERNAKGKQARQYFIECERKLRSALTPAEQLLENAKILVEQERRLAAVEEQQHVLLEDIGETKKAISTIFAGDAFVSVRGYAAVAGLKQTDLETLQRLGRAASKLCKQRGIHRGEVMDQRYGAVKTYPREIVEEVAEALSLH